MSVFIIELQTLTSLLVKPPLPHKTLKNIVEMLIQIAHQLRHFYINAVLRFFSVYKIKNLCRISQYYWVFKKHKKTHDRF